MVRMFPGRTAQNANTEEFHITLNMTFDLPGEVAEQLELWGINEFDTCTVAPDRRRLEMSARTTLYRERSVTG